MTAPLAELARIVRSKNAGPYELTLDVVFVGEAQYDVARRAGVLTRERIAGLYGVPAADVAEPVWFAPARAVKITLRRPLVSGQLGDTDVYGAQQHAPLLTLELPTP
ncbi:DUF4387 domain-containing protein [Streptomyces sp. JJ36]|uniref:DUF4387 domain-containing protein n=1 Tax=Streptomyces sp. JJ36 TaxID=2736645 RepID=UPI001F1A08AD|nr:DUF4387 domain-containing protein [Streptomyces sp. JJ36]MCF6521821.1 DUF4387 domain-containing protein [Streptomyces sp. JJ36]